MSYSFMTGQILLREVYGSGEVYIDRHRSAGGKTRTQGIDGQGAKAPVGPIEKEKS